MSSSNPRRSLRIRNANLPDGEEKEEPDKVDVKPAATKRRAAAIAADDNATNDAKKTPVKKSVRADKKVVVDQGDDAGGQKMDTVKEEEEKEHDKESEEEKTPTPAKKIRKMRDMRKNGQVAVKNDEEAVAEEEAKPAASAARPKRKSSLAAAQAIKKVTDNTNEDNASVDRDEGSVEEEGMEDEETSKKKRKRGPAKTGSTLNGQKKVVEKKIVRKAKPKQNPPELVYDTVTEDEDEEEEEKPKKRQRKTADAKVPPKKSSKKEPILQRPPSLDRPHEKVRLLMYRKYKVDRDEMLAWEKRSVQMARQMRKLEEEKNNGTGRMKEVMDRVYEFVARCLKGRIHEMGGMEAVRLCHVLQEEFDEADRKKKMTITQRIKETVENEKKEREKEAEESDEHGEDEDEWEDMETVDGEGEVKTVQVHVENQKDMNSHWKSKWLKQEVNREMRNRYENVHKAHLLSYMSHLRHLAAMALSPSSKHGEIPLIAVALSMLPKELMKTERKGQLGKRTRFRDQMDGYGEEGWKETEEEREHQDEWMKRIDLVEWWWNEFIESERVMQARGSPNLSHPMYSDEEEEEENEKGEKKSEEERMSEGMMKRRYRNHKEAAIMFFSLASVAGYSVRLVCRCEVVSKKVPESPEVKKKEEEKERERKKEEEKIKDNKKNKKNTTRPKKTVIEEPRKYPMVSYWIEMWDDVDEFWNTVDVIRSKPPREGFEAVEEEDYWEFRHLEPLNSSMEREGKVLYVLAIDNEFGLRDVSARYIHSTNFVSKEFRQRRANQEWMSELWDMEPFRAHSVRSRMEDDDWMSSMKVEMPKQVTHFKDHPLYVLDKDVLKMQRIFPYDVKPVGEIKGYKIYSRKFLRPTKPAKWYEKMGRQVMADEPPVGEKKLTNPITGETGMQGLFGYWQTEPWNSGEVVDGKVPRNEFDNIYMYQPEMCPKGGIYLVPDGLQRVAFELGKDFVQAVIGWMYKGGNIVPILHGAVFVKSDLPDILSAWKACEKRWKEQEAKARSERALTSWKRLIKGMLRLEAMRKEFEPIENKKKKGQMKLGDEAVRAEEAAAWPQQKYGADFFE